VLLNSAIFLGYKWTQFSLPVRMFKFRLAAVTKGLVRRVRDEWSDHDRELQAEEARAATASKYLTCYCISQIESIRVTSCRLKVVST